MDFLNNFLPCEKPGLVSEVMKCSLTQTLQWFPCPSPKQTSLLGPNVAHFPLGVMYGLLAITAGSTVSGPLWWFETSLWPIESFPA